MNNYNELRNKPRINGKEVIGDVNIPVPSSERLLPSVTSENAGQSLVVDESGNWTTEQLLPSVTSENAGQVLMVDESGNWTTGTVSGGSVFNGGDVLNVDTTITEGGNE